MNLLFESGWNAVQDPRLAATLLDVIFKSCVLLASAGMVCLCWRRTSAATRHLIWFLAVAGLPWLPLASGMLPSWQRAVWSVSAGLNSGNQPALIVELAPGTSPSLPAPTPQAQPTSAGGQPPGQTAPNSVPLTACLSVNWLRVALALWGGGAVLTMLYVGAGRLRLGWMARRAHPLPDSDWACVLAEACQALSLTRPVKLLEASEDIIPLTWGGWRPVVLLPARADQWPAERRRVVLLHELAHIKRWDYLTQSIARIVCAVYWFNPLVWLAARRMRVEQERACDDLVLNTGCRASEYADHLLEIARSFRRRPQLAGIAMARPSGLEQRIVAIVDASRARRLHPGALVAVVLIVGATICGIGGWKTNAAGKDAGASDALRQQQIERLKAFSAEKERQSLTLAAAEGEQMTPEYQRYFDAAKKGDWQTVTNMFKSFQRRLPYGSKNYADTDPSLRTSYWHPVLEIFLGYDQVVNGEPKYTQIAIDGMVDAIPAGSIFFGGTDPGRGLPTAFCRSHVEGDPYYTLTQNALADSTYLEYLSRMYGPRSALLDRFIAIRRSNAELQQLDRELREAQQALTSLWRYGPDDPGFKAAQAAVNRPTGIIDDLTRGIWVGLESQSNSLPTEPARKVIYIATTDDSQRCFQEYIQGASRRLQSHQLRPGEDVKMDNGRVQVSGAVAVMEINALIVKTIFDRNPAREFYIEESYPLDWMYPYLEPHQLVLKLNRQPLAVLPEKVVKQDHDYWRGLVHSMIGGWLDDRTPVQAVAEFVEKVCVRKDLDGFQGDPRFIQNRYAADNYSHWRNSIARVYAWRAAHAANDAERASMAREADLAFRQAWAMCPCPTDPDSPDVVKRYAEFLRSQNRAADADLVMAVAAKYPSPQQSTGTKSQNQATDRSTAPVLEFRLVVDAPSAAAEQVTLVSQNRVSGQAQLETLFLQKEVLLDQTAVQSAEVIINNLGAPEIGITLTEAGRKRFAEVTRQFLGKRLAVVVDGRVCSAPTIQSEISGGKGVINGNFSEREAKDLARKVNEAIARPPAGK